MESAGGGAAPAPQPVTRSAQEMMEIFTARCQERRTFDKFIGIIQQHPDRFDANFIQTLQQEEARDQFAALYVAYEEQVRSILSRGRPAVLPSLDAYDAAFRKIFAENIFKYLSMLRNIRKPKPTDPSGTPPSGQPLPSGGGSQLSPSPIVGSRSAVRPSSEKEEASTTALGSGAEHEKALSSVLDSVVNKHTSSSSVVRLTSANTSGPTTIIAAPPNLHSQRPRTAPGVQMHSAALSHSSTGTTHSALATSLDEDDESTSATLSRGVKRARSVEESGLSSRADALERKIVQECAAHQLRPAADVGPYLMAALSEFLGRTADALSPAHTHRANHSPLDARLVLTLLAPRYPWLARGSAAKRLAVVSTSPPMAARAKLVRKR